MTVVPSDLPAFIAAASLLAFVPGPDLLFVLTEGMLRGRKAGLLATLGLCSGLLFHTAIVALGVAALLQASPWAFAALRYLGAAYLLYLAWRACRSAVTPFPGGEAASTPLRAIYARGVLMNVTNPKVAIFFLAFLPQFTDPERGGVFGQILVLGATFMVCALVCFSVVTLIANPVGAWIRRAPSRQVKLNIAAALVFTALAGKLAWIG